MIELWTLSSPYFLCLNKRYLLSSFKWTNMFTWLRSSTHNQSFTITPESVLTLCISNLANGVLVTIEQQVFNRSYLEKQLLNNPLILTDSNSQCCRSSPRFFWELFHGNGNVRHIIDMTTVWCFCERLHTPKEYHTT